MTKRILTPKQKQQLKTLHKKTNYGNYQYNVSLSGMHKKELSIIHKWIREKDWVANANQYGIISVSFLPQMYVFINAKYGRERGAKAGILRHIALEYAAQLERTFKRPIPIFSSRNEFLRFAILEHFLNDKEVPKIDPYNKSKAKKPEKPRINLDMDGNRIPNGINPDMNSKDLTELLKK